MAQSGEHPSSTYQLKVILHGVPNPVWRRVLVSGDDRLSRVSAILQATMGWAGYHGHSIKVGGHEYGMRQFDELLFADGADTHHERDEARTTFAELGLSRHELFRYDYDPKARWEHEVIVERLLDTDGAPLPRCLGGAGACPPEESGGPEGYAKFLVAHLDPLHPEHEEAIDEFGGTFNPEAFSIDEVNERLSLFWPVPKAPTVEQQPQTWR